MRNARAIAVAAVGWLASAAASPLLAAEVLIFGDRFERDHAAAQLTALGYSVDVMSTAPANIADYGMVWQIGVTPLTSTDQTRVLSVLGAGGGLYLTGENASFEPLNASLQTVVRTAVFNGGGIVIGQQGSINGPYVVNPGAVGGVTAGLTTVPIAAAGGMSGVSAANVFATGAGGVPVAGVWASSDLVDGKGSLAVFMDVNWPANGGAASAVTANLATFLFPESNWQGGNGTWADAAHWVNRVPSPMSDATINPAGSATVLGSADAAVTTLRIAGNAGQIVTLNLNGGSTTARHGTSLEANAALAGSGLLGGALTVHAGARVNVGAGEAMQLTGSQVLSEGDIRVLGSAASPASLEVAGPLANALAGRINLQNANVSFLGGLLSAGQVNITFGVSTIAGDIDVHPTGKVIVSNGAQASFFDDTVNNGELRVSAGGAANFFGHVSGAGLFTGTGEVRYEGGFAPGNSTAEITVEHLATYSSSSVIEIELGGLAPGTGHDKIIFDNLVTLGGGELDVMWFGGWSGAANQTYDIFDWDGGVTGSFAKVHLPTLTGDLFWNTASLYTTGELSINAPIPEPQTYALLLAGLGLLGFAARRRATKPRSPSPASTRA